MCRYTTTWAISISFRLFSFDRKSSQRAKLASASFFSHYIPFISVDIPSLLYLLLGNTVFIPHLYRYLKEREREKKSS